MTKSGVGGMLTPELCQYPNFFETTEFKTKMWESSSTSLSYL